MLITDTIHERDRFPPTPTGVKVLHRTLVTVDRPYFVVRYYDPASRLGIDVAQCNDQHTHEPSLFWFDVYYGPAHVETGTAWGYLTASSVLIPLWIEHRARIATGQCPACYYRKLELY